MSILAFSQSQNEFIELSNSIDFMSLFRGKVSDDAKKFMKYATKIRKTRIDMWKKSERSPRLELLYRTVRESIDNCDQFCTDFTDRDRQFENGMDCEYAFRETMTAAGYKVGCVSKNDNITKHIVFRLRKDDITFSVDVKAMKTTGDLWIEFQNVCGNLGWLYGEATYIVFYFKDEIFLFVDRLELVKYAESIMDMTKLHDVSQYVKSGSQAFHCFYRRAEHANTNLKNVKNITTLLSIDEITANCGSFVVKKNSNYTVKCD
jgi:hypothetical protein